MIAPVHQQEPHGHLVRPTSKKYAWPTQLLLELSSLVQFGANLNAAHPRQLHLYESQRLIDIHKVKPIWKQQTF